MCKDAADWQLRYQSINIFEPQPTPLCCLLSCFASLWIDAYKSNGKLRQGYKVTTTMITGMWAYTYWEDSLFCWRAVGLIFAKVEKILYILVKMHWPGSIGGGSGTQLGGAMGGDTGSWWSLDEGPDSWRPRPAALRDLRIISLRRSLVKTIIKDT